MKKLLTLGLILVLALSLIACGGQEEAPAAPATEAPVAEAPATEAPVTEAATEAATEPAAELTEEEVIAVISEAMPLAYAGADEDGLYYYMMCDEEVDNGLICIWDEAAAQHVVSLGLVTENADGSLTITDEEDGYTISFAVAAMEDTDGTAYLELTMQDGAVAVLLPEDAAAVAEAVLTIELNTEAYKPE